MPAIREAVSVMPPSTPRKGFIADPSAGGTWGGSNSTCPDAWNSVATREAVDAPSPTISMTPTTTTYHRRQSTLRASEKYNRLPTRLSRTAADDPLGTADKAYRCRTHSPSSPRHDPRLISRQPPPRRPQRQHRPGAPTTCRPPRQPPQDASTPGDPARSAVGLTFYGLDHRSFGVVPAPAYHAGRCGF